MLTGNCGSLEPSQHCHGTTSTCNNPTWSLWTATNLRFWHVFSPTVGTPSKNLGLQESFLPVVFCWHVLPHQTTRYNAAQTAVAFRSLLATRTDVCSSALLARNICVYSFRPIFSMFSGDVAVQWRTELVTWVLGAVAKHIETRVPKLLEKEQCDRPSSVWHWHEQGAIQTLRNAMPLSIILSACQTRTSGSFLSSLAGKLFALVTHSFHVELPCNVQGTLTCPHPTPAPAPHPGSCGTSTMSATYKER